MDLGRAFRVAFEIVLTNIFFTIILAAVVKTGDFGATIVTALFLGFLMLVVAVYFILKEVEEMIEEER